MRLHRLLTVWRQSSSSHFRARAIVRTWPFSPIGWVEFASDGSGGNELAVSTLWSHPLPGCAFAARPILLIGYSKGATDILEAIVQYPELSERVVAVLSAAGSIGGSPLATSAEADALNVMRYFPGATCSEGDGGAVASLRPATRRAWLAHHTLPQEIAYYSLVTYPQPDRISSVLGGMYRKLSQVDARNDGQVIYYDQIIPNSSLLGFVNADHWALAVPIARNHSFMGATSVDKNDYPREALIEAVLRFVEEDLAQPGRTGEP